MSVIRYLFDENVNPRLHWALKQQDPDLTAWHVGEPGVPSFSTSDSDILLWCEHSGFILVTNNRASMPNHLKDHLAAGRHVPGIFILNPEMRIGETATDLEIVARTTELFEHQDQIKYLPLT